MAYFDTKSGSLEEAIRQAVGGQKIEEKMDAVNKTAVKKKFDDRKDKDIDNDGDVDSSDKFLHKRRKAISKAMSKDEGNKFGKALKDARENGEKTFVVSGKKYNVEDYDVDEEIDKEDEKKIKGVIKGLKGAVKAHTGQAKELEKAIGEEIKEKLDATPGQSQDDWNQQVEAMQQKNISMRETLAKMWGVEEGHNPFKKEEKTSKKEGKTMTGKPETKVTIDPDMKEKVKTETAIGKKNIK